MCQLVISGLIMILLPILAVVGCFLLIKRLKQLNRLRDEKERVNDEIIRLLVEKATHHQ